MRHRLVCLSMSCEFLQHFGDLQPMFVKLAWQFYEIPCNRRARDRPVVHVAEHLMQSMAKLVKQRPRIVV